MSDATASGSLWRPFVDTLDRLAADGRQVRFWLRDDDAVAMSPALAELLDLLEARDTPALLAVIPASVSDALATAMAERPGIAIAVHGWSHANHAGPGERAQELGPHRPVQAVLGEVGRGLRKLTAMFGKRALPALVPPWNRFDDALLPHLAATGFRALSAFGTVPARLTAHGLIRIDAHLDLIDWKRRRGRDPHWLVHELDRLVADSTQAGLWPIGVLTHHLVHDAVAKRFLAQLLAATATHPGARWLDPSDLLLRAVA